MGVVYLAVSTDRDEADLAAVKTIRLEYARDEEFRARFASEVELARRVQGPYTARVLDADTDGPTPWLATEYVPGPALNQAVRDNGPFPEDALRALAAGLAEALAAIHAVGLIHRDLKPSNVLLASRGPQVIDFGIARATDATALTRTGQTLGTPAYMSPEQATGSDLDPRSDLFAFGGVLLFAATGRPPFGTGDPAALLYRVVNEPPDLSGLPETLLPLVTTCLAKSPDDRPDLDAVLSALTGTVLPKGDDDATDWLPKAVATTIQHTLVAATRIAPTTTKVLSEENDPIGQEVNNDEGAPSKTPSSSLGAQVAESIEDPTPEASASTTLEVNDEEAGPQSAKRSPSHLQEPAQNAPAHVPEVSSPAQEPGGRTGRSSSAMLWGAAAAVVALVVVLGMTPGSSEETTTQAQPDPVSRETDESTPSPSPDRTYDPSTHIDTEIRDTAFLNDDRFVVLTTDGELHVYETGRPEPVDQLTSQDEDYDFSYSELYVPPDSSMVAAMGDTASGAPVVHVWDLISSERFAIERPGFSSGRLALSPDGETLFIGNRSDVIAYQLRTGEELYRVTTPSNAIDWQGYVEGLGTSPDGELLVAVMDIGLAVWDAATGERHPAYPELWEGPAWNSGQVVFHDGTVVTTTLLSESLLLWDIRSSEEPGEVPLPPSDIKPEVLVRELSVGASGSRIVTAATNSRQDRSYFIVWDTEGEILAEDRSEKNYFSVSASPASDRILVAFHPLGREGQEELVLLDEDLETVQEFQVPTH